MQEARIRSAEKYLPSQASSMLDDEQDYDSILA